MRQVPEERRVRFFEAEDNRQVIRDFDRINAGKRGSLYALNLAGQETLKGVLDVPRRERFSIVESNAGAKMKNIRQRVGGFPAFRQPRVYSGASVPPQQAVKNQRPDPLRLRIRPDPGIEVQRTGLDEHHDGLRIARSHRAAQPTGEGDSGHRKEHQQPNMLLTSDS